MKYLELIESAVVLRNWAVEVPDDVEVTEDNWEALMLKYATLRHEATLQRKWHVATVEDVETRELTHFRVKKG